MCRYEEMVLNMNLFGSNHSREDIGRLPTRLVHSGRVVGNGTYAPFFFRFFSNCFSFDRFRFANLGRNPLKFSVSKETDKSKKADVKK